MMIDFALEAERKEGKGPQEAIYEACLLRFRPIMMTTMAALLGGLPLALGTGVAAPTGDYDCGGAPGQPAPHALHDTGCLPCIRPPRPAPGTVAHRQSG